jgi:MSHA pilin protein MshA
MKKINIQKGFTLIELVLVIVILGILTATAAPKFINLKGDATTATLNAVKASMKSAAILVHAKSIIIGNQDEVTSTVTVNKIAEPIAYGYPRSNSQDSVTSWSNLLDVGADFTIALIDSTIVVFPVNGTPPVGVSGLIEGDCYTSYKEASEINTPPVPVVISCT